MKIIRSTFLKIACFYGAVILPFTALAQTDKLQLELGKCLGISDISTRVACYDNLARSQQGKTAATQAPAKKTVEVVESVPAVTPATPVESAPIAKAAASTPASARAEPEASKIEKFGQQPARIVAEANGEEVLVAKVTMIKEVETNKLQITLTNGQVWKQTIGKSFFLHENDTVRISPSGWGSSYRLEKDGKPGFIQVSRLR